VGDDVVGGGVGELGAGAGEAGACDSGVGRTAGTVGADVDAEGVVMAGMDGAGGDDR
jgi:hypothetical protein